LNSTIAKQNSFKPFAVIIKPNNFRPVYNFNRIIVQEASVSIEEALIKNVLHILKF